MSACTTRLFAAAESGGQAAGGDAGPLGREPAGGAGFVSAGLRPDGAASPGSRPIAPCIGSLNGLGALAAAPGLWPLVRLNCCYKHETARRAPAMRAGRLRSDTAPRIGLTQWNIPAWSP